MARTPANRARYAACWRARTAGDLPALLELAADPTLTADEVATVAPAARDHDAPLELVNLVLAHPACTPGVAGRYATYPDPTVRLRVARREDVVGSTLLVLAIDVDPGVAAAARAQMAARAPGRSVDPRDG